MKSPSNRRRAADPALILSSGTATVSDDSTLTTLVGGGGEGGGKEAGEPMVDRISTGPQTKPANACPPRMPPSFLRGNRQQMDRMCSVQRNHALRCHNCTQRRRLQLLCASAPLAAARNKLSVVLLTQIVRLSWRPVPGKPMHARAQDKAGQYLDRNNIADT